ncbi:MAG: hypothetical protein A2Y21_06295 [Clostridiales bacterium GWC2_40_7]|nr:MAG: hypothetical protein A2Y21_06295 [Clostridiales bacterium GWC2_40_7]
MGRDNSIWNVIMSYKLNSILLKYFVLVFLLIVIPLSAISISVYLYYSSNAEKEISSAYEQSLFKIRDTLDMIFADIDRLSLRLTMDYEVKKLLSSNKKEIINFETYDLLNSVRSKISIPVSEYIDSLYLYLKSGNCVISSSGYYADLTTFNDNDWYRDYTGLKGNIRSLVKYRHTNPLSVSEEGKDYITLIQIAPFADLSNQGAIIINIDVRKFGQFFGDVNSSSIEDVFIIDDKDTVLFNSNISFIGYAIDKVPLLEGVNSGSNISDMINIQGNKKLVSSTGSKYKKKYSYITIVTIDKDMKAGDVRNLLFYSILAGILLSVILAFIISINVYRPFGNIVSIINNPERIGNTNIFSNHKGYNELKHILSKILDFNINRKKMESNLEQYLSMLKKAQSIALQAQINPHFLYNTLGTINWMAIDLTKSENEVSHMITNLSDLLRLSLETQDNLIPIRDEIEYVKKYLEIEEIRFDNMFKVIWSIEPDILDCMIIKITLQPVIENAIYHGVKQKKEKGIISIKGSVKDENIIIYIEDDGVGMDAEKADSINRELKEDYIKEDHSIGLRNVNRRIKLVFGEKYGVTLESNRLKGTKVEIMVPKVEKDIS